MLYSTEKALLKLTNCVDAAEFEQMHAEGRLRMPFFASIKIQRRRSKTSDDQSSNSDANLADFNSYIVDAEEQSLEHSPSIHCVKLLAMLVPSVDSVLPAMLDMIRKSEHHALAVEFMTQKVPEEIIKVASKTKPDMPLTRPCARVTSLVMSTKRSQVSSVGEGGYKLVTDSVVDFIQAKLSGKREALPQYRLTSFCTLENVTDFKLDPSGRDKEQAASPPHTAGYFVASQTDSSQ